MRLVRLTRGASHRGSTSSCHSRTQALQSPAQSWGSACLEEWVAELERVWRLLWPGASWTRTSRVKFVNVFAPSTVRVEPNSSHAVPEPAATCARFHLVAFQIIFCQTANARLCCHPAFPERVTRPSHPAMLWKFFPLSPRCDKI